MNNIISKLNEIGRDSIDQSFSLIPKSQTLCIISGANLSLAINNRKNEDQQIKVLNLRDDFWVYIGIEFIYKKKKKKEFPNIFFSLSVFQGDFKDNYKTQLFRAEWDNFENFPENHAQPHWHIYPHKYTKKTHDDFEDFIELQETDKDFNTFVNNDTTKKIVDLKKFHFAMNGQWSEKKTDVHKISEENELIDWFSGILSHIKKELKYITAK